MSNKRNRYYCPTCLRKFFNPRMLATGKTCPHCRVQTVCHTAKVVRKAVKALRRGRPSKTPTLKDDYYCYLKSDLWKRIRQRVLERDGRKCVVCGSDAEVVHHKSYDRAVLDGLRDSDLVSLCRNCHTAIEFPAGGSKNGLRKANAKLAAMMAHAL